MFLFSHSQKVLDLGLLLTSNEVASASPACDKVQYTCIHTGLHCQYLNGTLNLISSYTIKIEN